MLAPTTNGIGTSDNVDDAFVVVTLGVTTDELYDFGHRDATMYLPAMGTIAPVGLGLALACRIAGLLRSIPTEAFSCRSGRSRRLAARRRKTSA
jgi:hypothetical protein